jgi:hypothetical protein
MPDINWLAAVAAGVLGFFHGAVWYSPVMFLNAWQKDMGLTGHQGGMSMAARLGSGILLSVIAAGVFAWLLGPEPDLGRALVAAVAVAVGIITTSFGIQYLFEGRTLRVTLINGGYHLVQFVIYALVLGLWH